MRKLFYSDKKDIFSYAKNPEVAKHVLWEAHKTDFDTLEFLNTVYEAYNKNKPASWGITLKGDNTIIGTIGFVSWDKVKKEAEIGYVLAQNFWGKGIITEASKQVVNFGFSNMELETIVARCKIENIGSAKVLENCGFTLDERNISEMLIKGKIEKMKNYYLSKGANYNV